MGNQPGAETVGVRETIGANIRRIRVLRGLKGQELVDRLAELGFSLPTSGLSEAETGKRRITAEELLIFAIALNTSVIDLLTPPDGKQLNIADAVEPLHPGWLENWLCGKHPWPPKPQDKAYNDEFFATASEGRKSRHRIALRPEIQEISALQSAVSNAIEGPGPLNQIEDPEVMAEYLREQLGNVVSYVAMLSKRLDKHGYGG